MIVNMSSTMGSIELHPDYDLKIYAYRSSKSALNAVTKCLAKDLKSNNITAIALSPGWVKTEMGGIHADLTPEQSVKKIRQLLSSLSLKDSGKFLHYTGEELPW